MSENIGREAIRHIQNREGRSGWQPHRSNVGPWIDFLIRGREIRDVPLETSGSRDVCPNQAVVYPSRTFPTPACPALCACFQLRVPEGETQRALYDARAPASRLSDRKCVYLRGSWSDRISPPYLQSKAADDLRRAGCPAKQQHSFFARDREALRTFLEKRDFRSAGSQNSCLSENKEKC